MTAHVVADTGPETPPEVEVLPPLDDTNSVEFDGVRYRVADSLPLVPLMRFAYARERADDDQIGFIAQLWALLRKLIAASDVTAWETHVEKADTDIDELMTFVQDAITVVSARPTKRSSASPDGPQHTNPSSPAGFTSRASSTRAWTPPAPVEGSGLAKDPRILELVRPA